MRRANLLIFAPLFLHCAPTPRDVSPWTLAREGTLHVQADLTASLDAAWVPPESIAAMPERSAVRIGGVTRAGIYMQTPCRARFPVFVHPDATFLAWAAMAPGAWVGSTDGAVFRVSIVDDRGDSILLGSLSLNPFSVEADRRWHRLEYSLAPWTDRKVWIELAVDPGPARDSFRDWCIWGEPLVYSPPLSPPRVSPSELSRQIERGEVLLDWCFVTARGAGGNPGGVVPVTSAFELGGARREGLYAHPPWSVSATLVPGTRPHLVASLGMVQSCHATSDGVMVRVVAQEPGGTPATLFEYWLCPRTNLCDQAWVDIDVPLARFAYRPVTVTLETTAGFGSNLECDSVTLGMPRIVSSP